MEYERIGDMGEEIEEGIDLDYLDEVEDEVDENTIPKDFDITYTMTTEVFDKYSTLPQSKLECPYIVFKTYSDISSARTICNGILTRGDVNLYMQEGENSNYLKLISIDANPKNIQTLLRLSAKDSVFYRHTEDSPERLVSPEQFIRRINIPLDEEENDKYWNNLINQEKMQLEHQKTSTQTSVDEIFG